MEMQACCFIGHRKVPDKELVYLRVKPIIEELVSERGVRRFLFGSRSEFDNICHRVVTELQELHPDIVRVNYHCKTEWVVKKEEKAQMEARWSEFLKKEVTFKDFDEAYCSDRIRKAGRASYVERNQEMIDDSDCCVFFYQDTYQTEPKSRYLPGGKSGTRIAYDYAVKRKKRIINIADRHVANNQLVN